MFGLSWKYWTSLLNYYPILAISENWFVTFPHILEILNSLLHGGEYWKASWVLEDGLLRNGPLRHGYQGVWWPCGCQMQNQISKSGLRPNTIARPNLQGPGFQKCTLVHSKRFQVLRISEYRNNWFPNISVNRNAKTNRYPIFPRSQGRTPRKSYQQDVALFSRPQFYQRKYDLYLYLYLYLYLHLHLYL